MKELVYHRLLLPAVERNADREAFIDGDYRATFGTHIDRVARLSSALGDLGIGPGDRFAVMALNGHQFLECYHAAFLGAGVINPLNLRLAPKELEYILADSGTKVCFTDQFFAPVIDKVRAAVGLEHVVMIGAGDAPHDVEYEDLLGAASPRIPDEPEEDDPAVLMYTGGTTGLPKGVLLDHRAEMLNLYHVLQVWRFDERDTFLHQTPMFHAASMGGMLGVPAQGGSSVFLSLFDPARVLQLCEQYSVTQTVMVPTMIGMLLGHPEFRPERLASLRALTYGSSPMPAALLERLLALFPDLDVFQGYGMTESSAVLTALGPAEHRLGGPRLQSAGRPLPGIVLQIQDAHGDPLPQGETGEVCARAGNFMREYWNKPDATADAFRGGWYHSGDAGHLDPDGFLFLVDRAKDMIIRAGENVYCVEIENVLFDHPDVVDAAVVGVPHKTLGEEVKAVVQLRPGSTTTAEELRAFCRERLADFKVPEYVELRDEPLPRNPAGKVLKNLLRGGDSAFATTSDDQAL